MSFTNGYGGFGGYVQLNPLIKWENLNAKTKIMVKVINFGTASAGYITPLAPKSLTRDGSVVEFDWSYRVRSDSQNHVLHVLNKFYCNRFRKLFASAKRYIGLGTVCLNIYWTIELGDFLSMLSMLKTDPESFQEIVEIAQDKEELKQMMGVRG